MAKRKRLIVPDVAGLAQVPPVPAEPGKGRAPVADMAGAASAVAALEELSDDLRCARAEGRMVVRVPLEAIQAEHLMRDRILLDEEGLAALASSLKARGQQAPLDVIDLGGESYGLISGWRRLTVLRRLLEETGEARFAEALCLVRQPVDAAESYLAMVEENEIRVGLSFYERAAIAARAADQGAFADLRAALRGLFGSVSKARRSKIGSFVVLYRHLDGALAHPTAIPERLGLALSQALEADPERAPALCRALEDAPGRDVERERAILEAALRPAPGKDATRKPAAGRKEVAPGVFVEIGARRMVLSGPGVDEELHTALAAWLAERSG